MSKPLYLGRAGDAKFELDGDRLVTHGVIFGMTGSGKTGLSIALLEELAGAGVPLLLLDPKGDLANLALLFPELQASQFEPWVPPGESAQAAADRQRQGLADWGLEPARLAALRDRMDLRIYTPGATSGLSVNLLGSFARPTDDAARPELVAGTVSSLLSLVGVEADPLRSPEHIVLSQILEAAWAAGESPALEALIVRLVDPPFKKVGVFPLDSFYPPDKRMQLAMQLNSVLASPSFANWTRGEALDPAAWTASPQGAPRVPVSVFSLAHLSDPERMFFVSLLLERVQAWSRTLSGTTGLRALVYFDEVAGYMPPHPANPASKKPLLTLMKQARAVGVGVLLATQNPVDVDYKGLANAATWIIGRLQTAQDRERVADGLLSATTGLDRVQLLQSFEQLKPRLFLIKQSDSAQLVTSRQTMAFLRGPLTRADLERLPRPLTGPIAAAVTAPPPAPPPPSDGLGPHPPPVPQGFANLYLDPAVIFSAQLEGALEPFAEPRRPDGKLHLKPALLAELNLRFDEDKGGFVLDETHYRVFFPLDEGLPREAFRLALEPRDLMAAPPRDALFEPLPTLLDEAHELKAAQAALVDEVFRNVTSSQFQQPTLKLYGAGGETREQFEERVQQAVQERIDAQVAKLHERYDREVAALQERIARQEGKLSQRQSEAQGRQTEQLWSAGETILGFFTGRKRSLGTALTKHRLTSQARQRADAAGDELAALQEKLEALEQKLESECAAIEEKERKFLTGIEERPVRLDRPDIKVVRFGVLWMPVTRRI